MKLKNIKSYVIGLVVASLAIIQIGCEQDWQKDFEPSVLTGANTATVSVSAVKDSTAIIEYSLSAVGRVFIAVVPGTDETETPNPQNILKLTVADAVFAKQIVMDNASELTGSVKVPGLIQNTSYKVFALPVNIDGVLGAVATTDAFKTSDSFNPTLDLDAGVSPAISSSAAQSTDFDITLTFSEPVVLAPDFEIELGYYEPISETINWIPVVKDSISISSNAVTIKQMKAELINGERVYLSIIEGSLTDRSGNPYEGITSGRDIDDEGDPYSFGIYWRVSWEAKAALEVLPADSVYITDPAAFIVIKLVYPYELNTASLDDYESSMIKVRYYDTELEENYNVPVGDIVIDEDTLEITIPKAGVYGSFVNISIAEGAVWDVYGNDVAAVDFDDYEWFISYGYTRDLIIGEYTVDCISWIDPGYDDTWTATITEGEDENSVIIEGIFGVDTAIVAVFDGDLGSLTITVIADDELVQDFGDIMGDGGDIFLRNPYGGLTIEAHIESDGSILAMPVAGYDVVADNWVMPLIFDCDWTKNGVKKQTDVKAVPRTFDRIPVSIPFLR